MVRNGASSPVFSLPSDANAYLALRQLRIDHRLQFPRQTTLIASWRVARHRRLGIAGAVLAAFMVMIGVRTAIVAAAQGAAPPGVDPLVFLVVPVFDMIAFAGFMTAAIGLR